METHLPLQKFKQAIIFVLLLFNITNIFSQDIFDGKYCPGPGASGDEYTTGVVFSQQLNPSPSSTCQIGTIRAKVDTQSQVLRLGMNIGNSGAALFRLYLDTDSNPLTGLTSDTFGGSLTVAGAEYILEINSNASTFKLYSGNGSVKTLLPVNNGLAALNGSATGCSGGGGSFLEFNIPFGSIGFNICDANNPGVINITKLASVSGNSDSANRCIDTPLSFGIPLKGDVEPDATICSGSNSPLLTLTGITANSTIVKWQSSVSPFSIWTDIANTAITYIGSNLTQTTKFRAVFTNSGLCAGSMITTSEATITVTSSPTIIEAITTNVLCKGASTGAINITPSGNTNYTYLWTGIGVNPTAEDQIGLTAGVYKVIVTAAGCSSTEYTYTITEPATIVSVSATQTNVLCKGAATGAINITPVGGVSPYNFTWTGTGVNPNAEDQTGLTAGIYKVIVKDANNCTSSELTVTITEPAAIVSVTATQTNVLCKGAATGTINITPVGGVSPYTFTWTGTGVNPTAEDQTGLTAGVYKVIVKDANNCTSSELTVTITEPAAIVSVTATQTNVLCKGAATGTINITPVGGVSPYTFTWTGTGVNPTAEDQTGLTAGVYKVIVKDANNCTSSELTVNITEPAAIVSVSATQTNVLCKGAATGAINITPVGGVSPYTFTWTGTGVNPTTEDQTGLTAGIYKVIVKDANNCTSSELTVNITEPAAIVSVSATQTNVLCKGAATGAINITPVGGVSPYTFTWTGTGVNPTAEDQTGLTAGIYKVIVKDANNCTSAELTVTITEPAAIVSVSATQTNVLCKGAATGAINITPVGGVSPYTFTWTGTGVNPTTEDQTGLTAGIYKVIVKDANNCTSSELTVNITEPAAIVNVSATQTNVLCKGAATGAINITPVGGVSPYTFTWTGTGVNPTAEDQTGLTAGIYKVIVKDANNCTSSELTVNITEPAAIVSVSATQTNVLCKGAATGAINITPVGGVSPYTFTWTGTGVNPTAEDQTGLTAGIYKVIVKDANNCTSAELTVTITEPAAIVSVSATQTNVLCKGAATGAINITPVGGVSPYTFTWTGTGVNPTTEDQTGLTAGIYKVIVKDANNCTSSELTVNITEPAAIVSVSATQTNVLCKGAATGAINITPVGGVSPYTFTWTGTGVNPTAEDQTGLTAGIYKVIVKDANNCTSAELTVTITEPAAIVSVSATQTNVLCKGAATGAINITPVGGVSPYTFTWTGTGVNPTTEDQTGLTAGIYKVIVKDANNCTSSELTVNITEPAAIVNVSATQTNVLCKGAATGAINITPVGGVSPYTFTWTGTGVNPTAEDQTGLTAGIYKVIVKDANNCTSAELTVTITEPADSLTLSISTKIDASCNGANTGSVIAGAVSNTVGTINYSWKNAENTVVGTTATVNNLPAGTYTLTVTDNCTSQSNSVTIGQPSTVIVSGIATNATCFGEANGSIAVTNSPGSTVVITNAQNQVVANTNLPAGIYTLTATAAGGNTNQTCTATAQVTITQPEIAVTVSGIATNATCFGEANGSIAVTNSPGSTVVITNAQNQVVANTNLPAGTYTLTATAAGGNTNQTCTATAQVTITQPEIAVTVSGVATNATCFGEANGSIAVSNSPGSTVVITNAQNQVVANTNLPAGIYTLTATAAGGNTNQTCTATAQVTITQPEIAVTVSGVATNATCFGEANGSIAVTNSPGSTVVITNAQNQVVANTNLPAGIYTLTATAAGGNTNQTCTATAQVTITQPEIAVTVSGIATNATCFGEANGSIVVTNSPGSTVVITNAQNQVVANTNLPAGTYTLTATAAGGNTNQTCTARAQVTITQPEIAVTVSGIATNATCFGEANGSIVVTNSPGSTVVITNAQNQVVANTNLPAGTYTLTATAAGGNTNQTCTATAQVTITQPEIAVTVSGVATNATCFGEANGSIAVSNSPGSTVVITNAQNQIVANTNLPAGTYTLTATAAGGNTNQPCTATAQVTITQPEIAVTVSAVATNATCFGEANGSIAVTNSPGSTVVITNAQNQVVANTNLPAGIYTLTATAAGGNTNQTCTATTQVTITQPEIAVTVSAVATNATCFGEANGSIAVTNSPGSTVVITNAQNQVVANTNLPAGIYTLTATAAGGNTNQTCTATTQVTITQPEIAVTVSAVATNATCFGEANGSIAVTNSPGSTVVITNAQNQVVANTNLPAGIYTLTATAAGGNTNQTCTATAQVTITQPEIAVTVSGIATNATCFGEANGSIAISNSSGSTVVITNAQNQVVANTNLPAGTYTLTATAAGGNTNQTCTATAQVTITQPEIAVTVSGIATNATCFSEANGSIAVTNSPGSTVVITNAQNQVVANTNLPAGIYTLTATAAGGNTNQTCTATTQVTITQPIATLTATAVLVNNNNCVTCSNGAVDLTPEGGTAPYTFLWSNGAITEDISSLPKGKYDVEIKDFNGCIIIYSYFINESGISITKDGTYVDTNNDGKTNIGDVVSYKFVIKNTGNVTLTNVTVTDNNAVVTGGSIATLAPGATDATTFTASHAITQEDINKGIVYNLATATAKDPKDKPVTATSTDPTPCTTCPKDPVCTDCTITEIPQNPSISITKDGTYVDTNNDGKTNIGDVVSYKFVIKNTGNVTLTNVTITDNNAVLTGGPIATLAPGATDATTFTASHVITQEDINKGIVYNLAMTTAKDPKDKPVTATSTDPTPCTTCPKDPVCTDCTITEIPQNPGISITKDGTYVDTNNDGKTNIGDVVSYKFAIKNTGNVTLTNVTVTDNNAVVTGGPIATLAPGATDATTFTASHAITQEDINKGIVYNLATATAKDPKDKPVTATSTDPTPCTTCPKDPVCTDCTITELTQTPKIALVKTASVSGTGAKGDVITYTFTVTNTGNTSLTNVVITDPMVGLTITGNPIATLAVGASSSAIKGTYIITQADIDAGKVVNTALATAKDPKGNNVTDISGTQVDNDTPTTTPLTQNPGISVVKTANKTNYDTLGEIIPYTIVVTNTGNVNLHQVVVSDPLTGLNSTIENLTIGESKEFSENYTVTQTDLGNETITNVATANGLSPNNVPVSNSDTVVIDRAFVLGCGTILVHNAFTPNGDGTNDNFVIDNIDDTLCYPENSVEIYNRWGILVYETKGYDNNNKAFKGYSEGRVTVDKSAGLPTGTYFYILNYTAVGLQGEMIPKKQQGYLYLTR